jgi:hypothetical protein
MSHIGELSMAAEAGYTVGRARRDPNHHELRRFGSRTLRSSFLRGIRRGRRAAALLEQLTLPGISPDGAAAGTGICGARGLPAEGRAATPGRD